MYCIEIQNPVTLSWHNGILKDIKGESFSVGYANNWKENEMVHYSHIRPIAAAYDPAIFIPKIMDIVEVQARNGPHEPFSWWKAIIRDIQPNNICSIQFIHFEESVFG